MRTPILLLLTVLSAFAAHAEADLTIRIWGSPREATLIAQWQTAYRRQHPEITIQPYLHGPDSTMAGVYTGVADLALMTREIRQPVERMAFEWEYHHPYTVVQIADGGPSTAIAFFVSRENPLTGLTLKQLEGIYGPGDLRRWGEVGLEGAWLSRPIHVYGPPVDSIAAILVRDRVLSGSYKWNPDYRTVEGDKQILAKLADDNAGIAVAPLLAANDKVKALAVADKPGNAFTVPGDKNYPLKRAIVMVLNRAPNQPIDPKVKDFLKFLLSQEGQQVITREGFYRALDPAEAQRQLQTLE